MPSILICFALKEEAAPFRKIAAGKLPLKIAQPFMAGYDASKINKSRQGRQKCSFVPDGTCKI